MSDSGQGGGAGPFIVQIAQGDFGQGGNNSIVVNVAQSQSALESDARVGIFGKLSDRKVVLADGDRVEVYRALIADPKEGRLRRAAARSKPQPK